VSIINPSDQSACQTQVPADHPLFQTKILPTGPSLPAAPDSLRRPDDLPNRAVERLNYAGGGGVGHATKTIEIPLRFLLEGNGYRGVASQSADRSRHITVPFLRGLKEPDRSVEAEVMTIEDYLIQRQAARGCAM
jgi:hypothetical protein